MDNYDRIMDLIDREDDILEEIEELQDQLLVCESPMAQRLLERTITDLEDECMVLYTERLSLEGRTSIWAECFEW